jgi:hypothetical protein
MAPFGASQCPALRIGEIIVISILRYLDRLLLRWDRKESHSAVSAVGRYLPIPSDGRGSLHSLPVCDAMVSLSFS